MGAVSGRIEIVDHRAVAVASEIVRIQRAAYAIEAELIGFDAIPPLHEDTVDVMQLGITFMGVVSGGEISGVLGYQLVGTTVGIDRLAIDPDHFRRGFARNLLVHLHEREHIAHLFEVSTASANGPARRLYESTGYASTGDAALPEGVTVTRFQRTV